MATSLATIGQSGPVPYNAANRLWTLSDLFSYIPGPTTRLSITSTAPFITPSHSGVTNPAGNLRVGFTVDTSKAPAGGWKASNYFTLTITLDDGQGVATTSLTTYLVVVPQPLIQRRIPTQDIAASQTTVDVVNLVYVFRTARFGIIPTVTYSIVSQTGGLTAGFMGTGQLVVSTPATAGTGTIVVRATATAPAGAPASLTASASTSFAVRVTAAEAPSVTPSGIPTLYMREGEEREYDIGAYLSGDNARIDTVETPLDQEVITAFGYDTLVRVTARKPTEESTSGGGSTTEWQDVSGPTTTIPTVSATRGDLPTSANTITDLTYGPTSRASSDFTDEWQDIRFPQGLDTSEYRLEVGDGGTTHRNFGSAVTSDSFYDYYTVQVSGSSGDVIRMQRRVTTTTMPTTTTTDVNRTDVVVSVSVISDEGSSVSTNFTVSVLAASVKFDFGIPHLSVSSTRQLTVTAPSKTITPATPYQGFAESYQIEAVNEDTSVFTRATSLPASIPLPRGGQWTVRAHLFLDGFSSLNTREARVIAPERLVGAVEITASDAITVAFAYNGISPSDVSDVEVRIYGDEEESFTPTASRPSGASHPQVRITPSAPGDYQVQVDAVVDGEPVSHRETIVFGAASTRLADGPQLLIGGVDYTTSLLTMSLNGGAVRYSALNVLRSNSANITLESDVPLSTFHRQQVVLRFGQRRVATLWVRSSSETPGVRRRVQIEASGALETRGPALIREAGRNLFQSDVLRAVAGQAAVRTVDYAVGEEIPPHKHIKPFNQTVADIERYGGFVGEDRFGRLSLGEDHFVPYDFGIGDVGGQIPVTDVSRPRGPAAYNAVDVPAQTIDADPVHVSTTATEGEDLGLGFTLPAGFDVAAYQPDATTHTLKRTALSATVTPALDGIVLRGEQYNAYTGDEVLKYTTEPNELPRDIPDADLPVYVDDRVKLQARATTLLEDTAEERRETIAITAQPRTREFDALSYLQVGSLLRYSGNNRRIDSMMLNIYPGEVQAELVLSPRFGSLARFLHYDGMDTYDSDRVWA